MHIHATLISLLALLLECVRAEYHMEEFHKDLDCAGTVFYAALLEETPCSCDFACVVEEGYSHSCHCVESFDFATTFSNKFAALYFGYASSYCTGEFEGAAAFEDSSCVEYYSPRGISARLTCMANNELLIEQCTSGCAECNSTLTELDICDLEPLSSTYEVFICSNSGARKSAVLLGTIMLPLLCILFLF
ncbi:hypothetical protein Pelo_2592 [Pelomyxa schiedti]|nr:hypothetical protein Pelo_2592 [Pelomyxa schiedti]